MKIIKMIPSDIRDQKRCYFCDTNKSVKYLVRPPYNMSKIMEVLLQEPMLVCCCNKCVAMNYEN